MEDAPSDAAHGTPAPAPVLGVSDRDEILASILARHPEALIAAINERGLFCAMPSSVPLAGQKAMVGRTALDLVVPEDRTAVIAAWGTAKETGAAKASVRLVGEPPSSARMSFVDARHRHG